MRAEGLRGVRHHLETRTGHTLARFVAEAAIMSEYNLYGGWTERFARHLHTWLDTSEVPQEKWPLVHIVQGWSYAGHGGSGIPEETLARYRAILEG